MSKFSFDRFKDPVSGLTHLGGAILGVVALIYLLVQVFDHGTIKQGVAFAIFGLSLVLLYSASASYHLLNISDEKRIIFRRLDHMMIFVLIAGSYTPYCLLSLAPPLGSIVLGLVWLLAISGFFLTLFWLHAPRWLSTSLYLLMGWLVVLVLYPLSHSLSSVGLWWLAIGGGFYTVGAVIYGIKRPDPYPNVFGFHEIWHLFVLAGSASHFISIATLI